MRNDLRGRFGAGGVRCVADDPGPNVVYILGNSGVANLGSYAAIRALAFRWCRAFRFFPGRAATILLRFFQQFDLLLQQLILQVHAHQVERHLLFQCRLTDVAFVQATLPTRPG